MRSSIEISERPWPKNCKVTYVELSIGGKRYDCFYHLLHQNFRFNLGPGV